MDIERRSWVEIDKGQIVKNYSVYKSMQPEGRKVMAVVKADAYGHGDVEVANLLQEQGVTDFAVSNIDEALRLRNGGIKGQILILGYTPINLAEELYRNDITQALLSEEYAKKLAETGYPIMCHFALDTGMRRIGLNADDPESCEKTIRGYAEKLQLTGLFTHLCVADTDDAEAVAFTKKQIGLFEDISTRVSDLNLPYCHCMNSAGGLWHEARSCFARLGIILYGLKPDYSNTLPDGIASTLFWKSVVSMVKEVKPGDTIGYGRTYKVEKPKTIATVPTGYADGYRRDLSNKGYVLINGRKAPIVGRVCMDQMMVDVTGIEKVDIDTEVVLIGRSGEESITADDIAEMIGTIGYEIVCGISKRVQRLYV